LSNIGAEGLNERLYSFLLYIIFSSHKIKLCNAKIVSHALFVMLKSCEMFVFVQRNLMLRKVSMNFKLWHFTLSLLWYLRTCMHIPWVCANWDFIVESM